MELNDKDFSKNDLDSLKFLINKQCNNERNRQLLANLLYKFIFGTYIRSGKRTKTIYEHREDAKLLNYKVLTSIGKWLYTLMFSSIKPTNIKLKIICENGHITKKPAGNIGLTKCSKCNNYINEKITGQMLMKSFGKEFVYSSLFDQIGEKIGSEDEILYFPGVKSMEIDYYYKINLGEFFQYLVDSNILTEIPLAIRGQLNREIIIVVESDGGQHRKDGRGFLSQMGLEAKYGEETLYERYDAYCVDFRHKMQELGSITKVYEEIKDLGDKRLLETYRAWRDGRNADDYRNNEISKAKVVNGYPYDAFLIRIPTWKLNNNERIELIFREIGKILGLSENEFFNRLNLLPLKDINWIQLIDDVEI